MADSNKQYGLGLVMSGGGVKGMVHAGVLQFFKEERIKLDVMAGASVGALVGAMYAAGKEPKEIRDFFINTSLFNTDHITFRKPGLLDISKFRKHFEKIFPDDSFEALSVPLYVTATEITEGELHIFTKGSIIDAILASSAFPLVFTPMEINGKLYLDGGILNHFPADLLNDRCERMVGIFLSPVEAMKQKDLKSMTSIIERTFRLGRLATSRDKLGMVDLLINPKELVHYNTFTIRNNTYRKLFDLGYQYAQQNGDTLRALAKSTS